jgi:hypothetical protein
MLLIDILVFLFYCCRESGKTVMLPIDHEHFEGLRRDGSRGPKHRPIPGSCGRSHGDTRSTEDEHFPSLHPCSRASGEWRGQKDLSTKKSAVDIEDALRLNVAGLAMTVFVARL